MLLPLILSILLLHCHHALCTINRRAVVEKFNPIRHHSDETTPLQVGNGNFAFGADITGLQTFLPFNTLTSWCWHNSSLPTTPNQTQPSDFTGLDWWTHGRLVNYEQPNPAEANISQWMIANPHRVNVGRVGLWFGGENVTESDLENKLQTLHMYNGSIVSFFDWGREGVTTTTMADPDSSTIAIEISSKHLRNGKLGVFLDYPYMTDMNKFEAPFVGLWNATANHTTEVLHNGPHEALIRHIMDDTVYFTTIHWDQDAELTGPLVGTHRYLLKCVESERLSLTVSYHEHSDISLYSPDGQGLKVATNVSHIRGASKSHWQRFWESGSFVDLTKTGNETALELQRRVTQSLYILAVNNAGFDPPQESGLVNNGWYGKFHAEQFMWNLGQWPRWGRWNLLERSVPAVYERFLATSIERAKMQGYDGVRWGKMSDPTGRSAPGEINSLLIWQQPHVMHFAEYAWRDRPSLHTLEEWDTIITQTADFMVDYAFWNESTGHYDLGPPMYPMSENTDPNATRNTMFEQAYWSFGLDIGNKWKQRQSKPLPHRWKYVRDHLAPLPRDNRTYVIYEGIPDMWCNTSFTEDHPSMLAAFGWLPAMLGLDIPVLQATTERVYETWNFTYSFGWDFPILAMNAARLDDINKAIEFLLHPSFQFDDAGYQIGGARVPTPYNPGAGSLLWAVAMLAAGWDGNEGSKFPAEWEAEVEGFLPAL